MCTSPTHKLKIRNWGLNVLSDMQICCRWAELIYIYIYIYIKKLESNTVFKFNESRNCTVHFRCFETWKILKESGRMECIQVIHKSVKHFKNSQPITTQRIMVVLTPIERVTLQVFLHISQMLNVSTFGNTADIYAIVHLVPHACQHITVDQSHSSGDTIVKIWRLAGRGGTKTVSFTNPQKKKSHGVKSGDRGGHRISASSSFPVRPIHLFCKFRLRCPRTSL